MNLIFLSSILACVVVFFSTIRYLHSHHSTLRYAITSSLFEIYVLYQRCFGSKTNDKISLKLQCIDEYCRKYVKKDFTNHTIDSAIQLVLKTRKTRQSFLYYSLPPTKEQITFNQINNIKCAWINKNNAQKNGIIISFHGGAYISGSAQSCFPYLIPLCQMTSMAGCSIQYSLCPEKLLPTPIDEGLFIYKYFIQKLNVNPNNIVFVGDSAGGSLVLLLIQKLIKYGVPPPRCAITMSTWDVPTTGESYIRNKDKDAYLDQDTGKIWAHLSVGNVNIDVENEKCFWVDIKLSLDDMTYSYLNKNASFKGFCPLFLSASEWECVLDDSLRVVDRCKKDGVEDVYCEITPSNGIHVLEDWTGYGVPEARILLQKEAEFILKYKKDC
eukprot:261718_1